MAHLKRCFQLGHDSGIVVIMYLPHVLISVGSNAGASMERRRKIIQEGPESF